ncbi:unnamed protein product [Orchesella dallaii]|uniref:Uncharacterized protein n=1 Tax=Orchesella dallaii TaxID=48710 RepID=A0ABP1S0N9_9HEXA
MPNFNPKRSKINLLVNAALSAFTFVIFASYVLLMVLLLVIPREAVFFGSLIPIKYYYFPVAILSIAYHAYMLLFIHIVILTIGNFAIIYTFYTLYFIATELKVGCQSYKTIDALRSPKNLRRIYRCFQVVHAHCFAIFGILTLFCNAIFMVTCIFCNFVSFQYWDDFSAVTKAQIVTWCVLTNGFWGFVLEMGCLFCKNGDKVFMSWKRHAWGSSLENAIMKKFRVSSMPIVLSYGKQFVIRRTSFFTFQRGVTRGTFRALLMTKSG